MKTTGYNIRSNGRIYNKLKEQQLYDKKDNNYYYLSDALIE